MRSPVGIVLIVLTSALLACSSDDSSETTSPLDGLWVDESLWRSHEAARNGRSPREVCSHIDPNRIDTIFWAENGSAYDCQWAADWKSQCEYVGSLSGHTILSEMDETHIVMTMEMVNDETMRPSTVVINGEPFEAEEVMERVTVQKRVSEGDIAEINEIITVTCR